MILPKKDEADKNSKCVKSITVGFNKQIGLDAVSNDSKDEPTKLNTTSLDFNLSFVCAAEQLYDALTKPEVS